jgi:hypothetical protein
MFSIDKSKLKDATGGPLTQSLFLEIGYNTDYAVYTLKAEDYEYNGVVYPSLRRLYLDFEDPTEYEVASRCFLDWAHWKRVCANKLIQPHVEAWREELEIKIRSRAVRDLMNLCASESGSFQAAKFLADRGWDKRAAGRPSKEEMAKRAAIAENVESEFSADVKRMADYRK